MRRFDYNIILPRQVNSTLSPFTELHIERGYLYHGSLDPRLNSVGFTYFNKYDNADVFIYSIMGRLTPSTNNSVRGDNSAVPTQSKKVRADVSQTITFDRDSQRDHFYFKLLQYH